MFQDHHLPKPGALLGKHWGCSRNWSGQTSGRTSCRGLWGSKFVYLMPSFCLCLEIHETLKIRGGRRAWSGAKWGEAGGNWGGVPPQLCAHPLLGPVWGGHRDTDWPLKTGTQWEWELGPRHEYPGRRARHMLWERKWNSRDRESPRGASPPQTPPLTQTLRASRPGAPGTLSW